MRTASENIRVNTGASGTRRGTRNSSRRIRRVFFNPDVKTCRCMLVKPKMISGPFQAIIFTVITLNPESNCTCRLKNHSPIPLKYIYVSRTADTTLDVMLKKNVDDYWNVDGDRELSDTWTSVTRFSILSEKPPDGYTWSGERLARKQTTSRPDTLWSEIWKHMSDASKRKEKQKWAIQNRSLTTPENCVVFASLIQMMKNARIS